MAKKLTRRGFVKGSLAASAGVAAGMSLEDRALLAQLSAGTTQPADSAAKDAPRLAPNSKSTLPTGKLGDLKISRIILGGNLMGGWAHSRDLVYVSELVKQYHTDEKILQTLELAEAHGINCVNTHPGAAPLIQRYRKERKGTIRWIAQGFPDPSDSFRSLTRLVDEGADSVYIQGNDGDRLVEQGKMDLLAQAVQVIRAMGVPAGVGGHSLSVPLACEKAKVDVDYYVKTLHTADYFTHRRPEQTDVVIRNPNDNFWCTQPEKTIELFAKLDKPWIAFKVMAAGAIPPRKAFTHAFANGADFVMAGMFDFQIAEDAKIANEVLAKAKKRSRPWRA